MTEVHIGLTTASPFNKAGQEADTVFIRKEKKTTEFIDEFRGFGNIQDGMARSKGRVLITESPSMSSLV